LHKVFLLVDQKAAAVRLKTRNVAETFALELRKALVQLGGKVATILCRRDCRPCWNHGDERVWVVGVRVYISEQRRSSGTAKTVRANVSYTLHIWELNLSSIRRGPQHTCVTPTSLEFVLLPVLLPVCFIHR
jgi:hypothetical protein